MFDLQHIQAHDLRSKRNPAPSVFIEGDLPAGFSLTDAAQALEHAHGLTALMDVEWAQYRDGGIGLVWQEHHPILFDIYDADFSRFTPGYRQLFTQAWLAHAQKAVNDAVRRGLLLDASTLASVASPRWWHDVDPRLVPFLSMIRGVSGNVAGVSPDMCFEDIELHLGGLGTLAIEAGRPSVFRFQDLGDYVGHDPAKYGRRVTLMGPLLDTANHEPLARWVSAVVTALAKQYEIGQSLAAQSAAAPVIDDEDQDRLGRIGEMLDTVAGEELLRLRKAAKDVFGEELPEIDCVPVRFCARRPSSEWQREQRLQRAARDQAYAEAFEEVVLNDD